MRVIVVIAGCVLLGLFSWWSLIKRHATGVFLSSTITVFHSTSEAFVFVGRSVTVIGQSRATAWLKYATGTPSIPETTLNEELLVFHFQNGKVSRSVIRGCGIGGAPLAFKNKIHWGRGRLRAEQTPNHWQWNGMNFVPLDDDEWKEVEREVERDFRYHSDANKSAGWTELAFVREGHQRELRFSLDGRNFDLAADQKALPQGRNRITIILQSADTAELRHVLVDEVTGNQLITAKEYRKLRAEGLRN